MPVRHLLLAAALVAASATIVAAQPRYQWRDQRPFLHYRLSPDRMRTLERAFERAERVRERARVHSLERLNTLRDRELVVRDRLNDRMRGELWRGMAARERAMERVRERLDRVREEQWLSRRRSRRI